MRFIQHLRHIPVINPRHWGFVIHGAVRHPFLLDQADVRAYPAVDVSAALMCAHQPRGDMPDAPLAYNAVWTGVPLSSLLADIEIDPSVTGAALHAADGYTSNLTLDQLRGAYLVYAMDGQPLPPEHGFPARIIVPGLYGYKMPKWIERIELMTTPRPGFWEARGMSHTGRAQAHAWIDAPDRNARVPVDQPLSIHWSWFVQDDARPMFHPIVTVDDAEISDLTTGQHPPNQITHHTCTWLPTIPGDYTLMIRNPLEVLARRTIRVR